MLQESIKLGDYRFTLHALQRTIERLISRGEIEQVILAGEVIETYPDDKYGLTYLIYGQTEAKPHLHVLVSAPPAKIITAYEPDPDEWDDYRLRKARDE